MREVAILISIYDRTSRCATNSVAMCLPIRCGAASECGIERIVGLLGCDGRTGVGHVEAIIVAVVVVTGAGPPF